MSQQSAPGDLLPAGEEFVVIQSTYADPYRYVGRGGSLAKVPTGVYIIRVRSRRRIWRDPVVGESRHPVTPDPDRDVARIAKAKADHASRRRAFHRLRKHFDQFLEQAPRLPDGCRFVGRVEEGRWGNAYTPQLLVEVEGAPGHLHGVIDVPLERDLTSRIGKALRILADEAWMRDRRRAFASEAER